MTLVHASCVALERGAVLLRGPSGSGKSDLALRLIDGGALLVADDYVALTPRDGLLMAHPPNNYGAFWRCAALDWFGLIICPAHG
ncbi:HPr kinase/phosphorylase [Iodidimonas gelatinilytica]